MKFEIKHSWSGSVLFETEAETQKEAVERAVAAKTDLSYANLSGWNLNRAELNDAKLNGAELNGAKLNGAMLNGAKLNRAMLNGAELNGAMLNGAMLNGAELNGAMLNGAELNGAMLNGAELNGAMLNGAELNDAMLNGAKLNRAELNGAMLNGAKLTPIRDDFFAVLSCAPREVGALRMALTTGKVNGSTYRGECACLVGTIANAQHVDYCSILGLAPNPDRPSERFFLAIREGDTPETNQFSALAVQWLDQWVVNMESAFGSKLEAEKWNKHPGGYFYLATPYTKYATGREQAFIDAAEQTAILIAASLVIFSPIVHSHPLQRHGCLDWNTDFEAWQHVDEVMMRRAIGLIVCKLPGWDESYGIKAEIEWFHTQLRSRQIYMMEPGVVPRELLA